MRVLTLLSPAKTLNWAASPPSLSELWTQPRMLKETDPVIHTMRGKSKADLKKLAGVSDSIAQLNYDRFKAILCADNVGDGAPDKAAEYFRPAALAYDGPAYRGLDARAFSQEDWSFAIGSVRLLTGLYGVLRPTDMIQPYRLEMGTRVGVSGKKDLYEYWKEDITRNLLRDVSEDPNGPSSGGFLVVNVASQEYSKAVDFDRLEEVGAKVVTCVFKDDGRVLSVFAKRARGLFARHVVMSRAEGMSDLENFSAEGYRLDKSQSKEGLLVFARSKAQRVAPGKTSASAPRTAGGSERKSEARKKDTVAPAAVQDTARGQKRVASSVPKPKKKANRNTAAKKPTATRTRK